MIYLDKPNLLEFSVDIQNNTNKLDKASFIIECNGYDISLPITYSENKAIVNIPVLKDIVEAGNRQIRMEMILGGVVYTPFKDILEFVKEVAITVEDVKSIPSQCDTVIVVETRDIKSEVIDEHKIVEVIKEKSEFTKLLEDAFHHLKNKK